MPEKLTQNLLKEKIGEDVYTALCEEADKEVRLAMAMPLVDQYRQENYYKKRWLLPKTLEESRVFEDLGLKITPVDVIHILFLSKLLFAAKTEQEYIQRSGGGLFLGDQTFAFWWEERERGIDFVIDNHFERLAESISEKTLLSEIKLFETLQGLGEPSIFFRDLFTKLNLPFEVFFDDSYLIEKYKVYCPNAQSHTQENAKRYFCAPSIGVKVFGSNGYVYTYGSVWLRTLLSMLRIGAFIHRSQIDFGYEIKDTLALTTPVIAGTNSHGVFSWNEDAKRPWEKLPDGSLFLSYGYRGISQMWLDNRLFPGIEKFFTENRIIFDKLQNPWNAFSINDIAPSIELLSATTQMMDLGAKVLLIYCCLEHMFVPKNIRKDNVKYIIGGINALRPQLLPWFEKFYQTRCDYAHKGFIFTDDSTRGLVFNSVENTFNLLTAKLKNN